MAVSRSLPTGSKDFVGTSLISNRNKLYKDIDLSLAVKPGVNLLDSDGQVIGNLSGDVYKKVDAAAVTQSLKTLLLTNKLDKPFQADFGADLQQFLFSNISELTRSDIKEIIRRTIRRYEPRALVTSIDVDLGPFNATDSEINAITITIVFSIGNTEEEFTFTTTLNRLR